MGLSVEEVKRIAQLQADLMIEDYINFPSSYADPPSVESGLKQSQIEEFTATQVYRRRAEHARINGYPEIASHYLELARDESDHDGLLQHLLSKVKDGVLK